jgi:hypothetical protein
MMATSQLGCEVMIVAHKTGNGAWTPQTPDSTQASPTFKRSGEDCRCFVIVAVRYIDI